MSVNVNTDRAVGMIRAYSFTVVFQDGGIPIVQMFWEGVTQILTEEFAKAANGTQLLLHYLDHREILYFIVLLSDRWYYDLTEAHDHLTFN